MESKKYNVNNDKSVDKIADILNTDFNKKLNIKSRRPTFTFNGKPVRAAGILCYIYDNKKKKKFWLFRKELKNNGSVYCDTGGKTDSTDNSPIETAIRETVEETNGHLFSGKHSSKNCKKILCREFLNKDIPSLYCKRGKYMLYIFKLNFGTFSKPLNRFGLKEDNMENQEKYHSYHWLDTIPTSDIHPRLKSFYKELVKFQSN